VGSVRVLFFKDDHGRAPLLDWAATLKPKARAKLIERVRVLKSMGYRMLESRTMAAYLRDDIYELRFKSEGVQYRTLFFFSGRDICMLSHGLAKDTAEVPAEEIDQAIESKQKFEANHDLHTYREFSE